MNLTCTLIGHQKPDVITESNGERTGYCPRCMQKVRWDWYHVAWVSVKKKRMY